MEKNVDDLTFKFLECLTLKKKYFVEEQLRRVVHISVCGQMHGVVYWKQGKGWTRNSKDQVEVMNSKLFTNYPTNQRAAIYYVFIPTIQSERSNLLHNFSNQPISEQQFIT